MVAPHQQVSGDAEKFYTPADSVGNVAPNNVVADNRTDMALDIEKGSPVESYEDSDPSNHQGIDVNYAKHEFEGLRRRYSELSRTHSRLSGHSVKATRTRSKLSERDVEDGAIDDSESQFDVEGVLRGRKKQMDEEEQLPKNLGRSQCGKADNSRCIRESYSPWNGRY